MKYFAIIFLCIVAIFAKKSLIKLPQATRGDRIIGGQHARAGQFPWQVAIYKQMREGRFFGSGILISDLWVLTSAQCTRGAMEFTIQLGSNELNSADGNRKTVSATIYYNDPRFDPYTSLEHDIGLIKFHMPVEFSEYIQPVEFGTIGYLTSGQIVQAVGWGQINDADAGLANELQYVEVSIMDQFECRSYYGQQLFDTMICAEGNYNEGTCFGDIGGSLVTPSQVGNHSVAVAIASFVSGNGCESTDPSGYTRIEPYYEWIVNTTRDQ